MGKPLRCKCGSYRIASVWAKCNELCDVSVGLKGREGYPPTDMGISTGNDIEFKYCLECGQMLGKFPKPETSIEKMSDIATEAYVAGMSVAEYKKKLGDGKELSREEFLKRHYS